MNARLYPAANIEGRIEAVEPVRGSHQRDWPTTTVVEQVTVVIRETWGTRAGTFEVAATVPVDPREGLSLTALKEAQGRAHYRITAIRKQIEAAHPDYMIPARY